MVFKGTILSVLVVAASAGHLAFSPQYIEKHDGHHEVVSHGHGKHHHHDYLTYPKYKFEYKVEDHHTKNHKTQHEARVHHDVKSQHVADVKGYYTLHDPEGIERHVHHHSDKKSGLHADVKHSTHHVVPKHHHHH